MHVVIFRSTRRLDNEEQYAAWAERLDELVRTIDGYISHDSYRDPQTQRGVTLSYFASEEVIKQWREHPVHLEGQELGRTHFYEDYSIEVAVVERSYEWSAMRHGGRLSAHHRRHG